MPSTGPETNCMAPQVRVKTNCQSAAAAVVAALVAPKNERIRPGSTGIISPNDRAFITAVAKMKPNAACRPRGLGCAAARPSSPRPTRSSPRAPSSEPCTTPAASATTRHGVSGRRVREAVARDVGGRHAVPAGVLDGDPGFLADRLRSGPRPRCPDPARTPPGASRTPAACGGSQARMRPISNTLPPASVSISRPPSPGSNASTPGSRGVNANSGLARHQAPISPTNASNARSGRGLDP